MINKAITPAARLKSRRKQSGIRWDMDDRETAYVEIALGGGRTTVVAGRQGRTAEMGVYDRWRGRVARAVKEFKNNPPAHRMPESFKAFCRMVSFTAANTNRMFVVSVACVRLRKELEYDVRTWASLETYCGYKFRCARLTWLKRQRRYFAARLTSLPPE